MSTKESLAYEDRFHFYVECFNDNTVYLRQSIPAEFEVNQDEVTIGIPADVMDNIAVAWLKYRKANVDLVHLESDLEVIRNAPKKEWTLHNIMSPKSEAVKAYAKENDIPVINLELGTLHPGDVKGK
jgi:hypothetical protein